MEQHEDQGAKLEAAIAAAEIEYGKAIRMPNGAERDAALKVAASKLLRAEEAARQYIAELSCTESDLDEPD